MWYLSSQKPVFGSKTEALGKILLLLTNTALGDKHNCGFLFRNCGMKSVHKLRHVLYFQYISNTIFYFSDRYNFVSSFFLLDYALLIFFNAASSLTSCFTE